ncbi:hypothetical protein JCM8202_003317 [Rhodotorula sphaerocarpa]
MPSSDYQHRPGGSLKLKGGAETKKKKSKKSKSSTTQKVRDEDADKAAVTTPADDGSRSPSTSATKPYQTEAERRFEEVQRKRLHDKAAKQALKSHKDRVAEFNEKLENMSEIHDIPRAR